MKGRNFGYYHFFLTSIFVWPFYIYLPPLTRNDGGVPELK